MNGIVLVVTSLSAVSSVCNWVSIDHMSFLDVVGVAFAGLGCDGGGG